MTPELLQRVAKCAPVTLESIAALARTLPDPHPLDPGYIWWKFNRDVKRLPVFEKEEA